MTNEKRNHAIEWITRELGFLRSAPALNGCEMKKEWAEQIEVFEAALEALKDHVREDTKMMDHFPDATKMVPLTIEQLREMRGKWVWLVIGGEDEATGWAFVTGQGLSTLLGYDSDRHVLRANFSFEENGKEFTAYIYPPAHIDREVLCGEWQGEADGYADGELVYDVWRCGDCGHVEETDDPELLPRFCPSCGRAMRPEALAELKHRMGVCT